MLRAKFQFWPLRTLCSPSACKSLLKAGCSAAAQPLSGDWEELDEMELKQSYLAPSLLHVGAEFLCRHFEAQLELCCCLDSDPGLGPWAQTSPLGLGSSCLGSLVWPLDSLFTIPVPDLLSWLDIVGLEKFLPCWPLSFLAPSFLLDLIIPWHLRSCKILYSKLDKK